MKSFPSGEFGPRKSIMSRWHWVPQRLRHSGVPKRASAAHTRWNLCEGLKLLRSFDQIDGSTTAIDEHLVIGPFKQNWQLSATLLQTDNAGLDIIGGTTLSNDGRASASSFGERGNYNKA